MANCAPRLKVTFFDVEAPLSSESMAVSCSSSCRAAKASLLMGLAAMTNLWCSIMDWR